MKNILYILFLLLIPNTTNGQTHSFAYGVWGYENCQTEPCYDLNSIPSELYWNEEVISICISQDEGIHVSHNFSIFELIDNSYFEKVDILIQSQEGYIIQIEGYRQNEKTIILNAKFYYDGFLIGILSHPIIN